MKRSMILIAAVFAMASTAAIAEDAAAEKAIAPTSNAVKLTDAELDNITAGSATVLMFVFNPGNASVFRPADDGGFHCVNCIEAVPGIKKLMLVVNPAKPVFHCVGAAC
jgi:hypothetical protein